MRPRSKGLAAAAFSFLAAAGAAAQHEHAPPPTPTPAPAARHEHPPEPAPRAATPDRNLFQSDMALMTGMTPRESAAHPADSRWRLMALGVARLSYNDQGGPSGDESFESTNWSMLHLGRARGRARLSLMLMNSLEPWTLEKRGSPELFQTGETFRGAPLVDRQHPHDFFMNLSATLRLPVSAHSAAWFQLAPVGEPVIGPTAFMHRASSGENPTAPLGHHWQDSTHITYNVVTAGVGWQWISVEGSAFHGEEPDEDRWDIEGGAIDSAAGRLRLSLLDGWSAQASYAYLHEPEALEEGDTHRATASVHYGTEGDRPFAATLLWGRNDEDHGISDAWLLEAAWQATVRDHVYARAEWVEKDRHLLQFKGAEAVPAIALPKLAEVGALTAGYLRDFVIARALHLGAGADLTVYRFPSGLDPIYGNFPVSWHLFLRVRLGAPHGTQGTGAHAVH